MAPIVWRTQTTDHNDLQEPGDGWHQPALYLAFLCHCNSKAKASKPRGEAEDNMGRDRGVSGREGIFYQRKTGLGNQAERAGTEVQQHAHRQPLPEQAHLSASRCWSRRPLAAARPVPGNQTLSPDWGLCFPEAVLLHSHVCCPRVAISSVSSHWSPTSARSTWLRKPNPL